MRFEREAGRITAAGLPTPRSNFKGFLFQDIMKYTIHVNQAGADGAGLRGIIDIIDLAVFDAFKDFANSNRCEKMVDAAGMVWFWIDYSLVIQELPYCNLNTKDSVYRRMRRLAEAKIIEFNPDNQKMGRSFFRWSDNYDTLITTTKPTEENPKVVKDLRKSIRRGTDKNPKTYGNPSEGTMDKNPNYHTTNNPTTNPLTKPDSAADAPDNGPTVVIEIEEVKDGKNGTASKGAGPMTNWTKRVASMFDEVGRRESEAAHIDYQPFNWSVCQEENFRQLKNIRDFAIIPDWKTKYKREPNETELDDCFRIIFTLGWHYLRKIQKEKGGAHHYTPTTIYKQYNPIKTFKHNGSNVNNSGPSNSERDIYRQFTFGEGINDFG